MPPPNPHDHITVEMELPPHLSSSTDTSSSNPRYSNVTVTPEKSGHIPSTTTSFIPGSSDLSGEIGPVYGSLGIPCEPNSSSDSDDEHTDLVAQFVALGLFRMEKLKSTPPTTEEIRQGFRMEAKADPSYLCFRPSKNDHRKYLSAQPLNGPPPTDVMNFTLPVSRIQIVSIVFFWILIGAFGVAMYFLFVYTGSNPTSAVQ